MQVPAGARLKCEFGIADAIGSGVIWVLLTIVTLGLAAFVAPYYIFSAVVNKTSLVDENDHRLGQLRVTFTLAEIVGHAVIWLLLSVATLGLAVIIYYYMVLRKVLERTEIISGYRSAAEGTPPPLPRTSRPRDPQPPARTPEPGAVRR